MVDALVSKMVAHLDDCLVDHLAAHWVWRMADSMVDWKVELMAEHLAGCLVDH